MLPDDAGVSLHQQGKGIVTTLMGQHGQLFVGHTDPLTTGESHTTTSPGKEPTFVDSFPL